MKNQKGFLLLITSILLLSTLLLTGCMEAIGAQGGASTFTRDSLPLPLTGEVPLESAPTSQEELSANLAQYSHEQEDGSLILFNEEEYAAWKAKREGGEHFSLSYDEVLSLIGDSIALYRRYDRIVLTNAVVDGFTRHVHLSSNAEIVKPVSLDFTEPALFADNTEQIARYEQGVEDILNIIYYRLCVMSSPDAFFTGAEAVLLDGNDPVMYNGGYPEYLFYLTGYEEGTDREAIVRQFGGTQNFTDLSVWKKEVISFPVDSRELRLEGPGRSAVLFPTGEMETTLHGFTNPIFTPSGTMDEAEGPVLMVHTRTNQFMMSAATVVSFAQGGKYTNEDGVLTLYFEERGSYTFRYDAAEKTLTCTKVEGEPPYDVEVGQVLRPVNVP